MSSADDQYEPQNDTVSNGVPAGDDPTDAATADSDETLTRDDADAIDRSNIVKGERTRGAKPTGGYTEPGDEEGLPTDDGTSSTNVA
ncbi:hypothetical protein MMC08_003995 [Hypocenomyce scalaris]|nr:hypothetical protein [Hypocenomyce scalaris]